MNSRRSSLPFSSTRPVNQVLARLPADVAMRWQPRLEPVQLHSGQVLCEANRPPGFVYFPVTCIVSMMNLLEDGSAMEVAVIGNEGLVGIAIFLGGETSPGSAIVHEAGSGFRLEAAFMKQQFDTERRTVPVLLRYTQALITQMAQLAVCNRHHALDQQLCRWLLFRLDRLPDAQLAVTQEIIARHLGVRRQGITECFQTLHAAGVIRHARGHVTVLDRAALETRACECYSVVSREYRRLLA